MSDKDEKSKMYEIINKICSVIADVVESRESLYTCLIRSVKVCKALSIDNKGR